jgi:hypothetical protein
LGSAISRVQEFRSSGVQEFRSSGGEVERMQFPSDYWVLSYFEIKSI